jgi:hypothetical protein
MRLFVALSLLVSTLSATTFFDPPNPTSATPVIAHVTIPPTLCTPSSADVARNGASIAIALHFPPCPLSPPGFVPFDFAVNLGVLPAGLYDVITNGTLDRGTLVVRDATPPFDVVPNVVPVTGSEIHLRSTTSPLLVCPSVCLPFSVKIDGKPVAVLTQAPDDIVVSAPPHAAGAVDVTLERSAGPGVGTLTATAALDSQRQRAVRSDFLRRAPVRTAALLRRPGARSLAASGGARHRDPGRAREGPL